MRGQRVVQRCRRQRRSPLQCVWRHRDCLALGGLNSCVRVTALCPCARLSSPRGTSSCALVRRGVQTSQSSSPDSSSTRSRSGHGKDPRLRTVPQYSCSSPAAPPHAPSAHHITTPTAHARHRHRRACHASSCAAPPRAAQSQLQHIRIAWVQRCGSRIADTRGVCDPRSSRREWTARGRRQQVACELREAQCAWQVTAGVAAAASQTQAQQRRC